MWRYVIVLCVCMSLFVGSARAEHVPNTIDISTYFPAGVQYTQRPAFGVPASVGGPVTVGFTVDESRSYYEQCHASAGDTYLDFPGTAVSLYSLLEEDSLQASTASDYFAASGGFLTYAFYYPELGYGDTIGIPSIVWAGAGSRSVMPVYTAKVYKLDPASKNTEFFADLILPTKYNTLNMQGYFISPDDVGGNIQSTFDAIVAITMPVKYARLSYPRIRVCDTTITSGALVATPTPERLFTGDLADLNILSGQYDNGVSFLADREEYDAGAMSSMAARPDGVGTAAVNNWYPSESEFGDLWRDSGLQINWVNDFFYTPALDDHQIRISRGDSRVSTLDNVGVRVLIFNTQSGAFESKSTANYLCPQSPTPDGWTGSLFVSMCRIPVRSIVSWHNSQNPTNQYSHSKHRIVLACPRTDPPYRPILCSPTAPVNPNMTQQSSTQQDTRPGWFSTAAFARYWAWYQKGLVQYGRTATAVVQQRTPTRNPAGCDTVGVYCPLTPQATLTQRPITPTAVIAATRTQQARERATQTKIAIDLAATANAQATRARVTATAAAIQTAGAKTTATVQYAATATSQASKYQTAVSLAKTSAAATVTRAVKVDDFSSLAKNDTAKNFADTQSVAGSSDVMVGLSTITGAFTSLYAGASSSPCAGIPVPMDLGVVDPVFDLTGWNVWLGDGLCIIRNWLESQRNTQLFIFIRLIFLIMVTLGVIRIFVKWITRGDRG